MQKGKVEVDMSTIAGRSTRVSGHKIRSMAMVVLQPTKIYMKGYGNLVIVMVRGS